MNKSFCIGLGTAAIGRPQYINIKNTTSNKFDRDQFIQKGKAVLDTAYSQGVRYFDTAPGYGIAEQILIEWLSTKNDASIEVATKWGYTYVANFDPLAKIHEIKDHSLAQLVKQWGSSKQLFPHLTTYQIHSATFDTGVLESIDVLYKLAELKDLHQLKMGITTTGSNQIEVLNKALDVEINGIQLFDAFQVTYNILDQSLAKVSNDLIKSGKRIIIKEALANGRVFRNKKYPIYSKLYDSLENLARKYEVGVDAIALRFCLETIHPYTVLSGASEEYQILENLKAQQFELKASEIELLKSFAIDVEQYWGERKRLNWN